MNRRNWRIRPDFQGGDVERVVHALWRRGHSVRPDVLRTSAKTLKEWNIPFFMENVVVIPLLYSVSEHDALEATQEELADDEILVAYLDDIHVVSPSPIG